MESKKQLLSNSLWFDDQAEEAARFYTSVFPESEIGDIVRYSKEGYEIHGHKEGTVMTVSFYLYGTEFVGINGGPQFRFNPAISYFIVCESEKEAQYYWDKLIKNGAVLMPLDQYDWSSRYGWLKDRYGVTWQIYTGSMKDMGQKIIPAFMFMGEQHGKAEEAMRFYTSVFKNSALRSIMYFEERDYEPVNTIKHARFSLNGQPFVAFDSAHQQGFGFNEAISMVVNCETQEEIDYYWSRLSEGGEEGQCGWLKDKYGVFWQVEPARMVEMLKDTDKAKVERVTKAFLHMKKFDIAELEEAYNG